MAFCEHLEKTKNRRTEGMRVDPNLSVSSVTSCGTTEESGCPTKPEWFDLPYCGPKTLAQTMRSIRST